MYPMNRFMDSHPYQRNQVPYNPHYYPHFEPNSHHMNIDQARSTLPCDSWPCGGNYGHPYPPPCHSCCLHNNSTSQCAFRPPYPYFSPPPYSNGNYPAYPVMHPAHYVPPPHFTMEQPRYEYEKNMDRDHHCCGCPNHPCSNKKGGSSVKIEEHDQDKENESNESMVPLGFKNCPYPAVWLPPGDLKNRERMKPNGSKDKEEEEDSQVVKPYGNFRPFQQPNVWNVWPPHHGNNSESPKQRGDFPGKQHHDDVNRKQFPFPIFWMPYKPEEAGEKVNKESDSGLIAEQEPTSPSKLIKPMLHDSEEKRSNSEEHEVNSESEIHRKGVNKESVIKTIPVKQVEQNEKVLDGKKEDASQKRDGDSKQKKITQDGGKNQSSSPTKSSKLPPVCLRVDPLPKKKSSNGSSRSPSPLGGKRKLAEPRSDSSKPPILSNEKEKVQLDKSSTTSMPEKNIDVEPSKSKTKVVEVAQGTTKEDKLQHQCTVFPNLKRQGNASKAANETKDHPDNRVAAEAKSSNEGHQRGEARKAANGEADAGDKMKRDKRSELSDDKAATMIQSAYRGFNVRRWEPLKKLKQIAKIKEQMAELKIRCQDLENSADNGGDSKQRTIITEAIMDLLLKLDTIQGLHPTVRENRKSVAKELVSLQEKLDLLNCKEQLTCSEQALTAKSSEDTCSTVEDNVSLQGGQEVKKLERGDDLAKGEEGLKSDVKGPCEEQPLCAEGMLSNPHHIGNAEVQVETKDVEEVMENLEMGDGASEKPFESSENANDKLLDENTAVVEKLEEHDEAEQSLATTNPFSEELIANSDSQAIGCGFKEKGDVLDELEELPRGILDEETSVQGPDEIRKDEILQHDRGDLTAHIPEEKVSDTESLEHHPLEALGETPVILEQENTDSSNGLEGNAEVQERDAAVLIDIPKREKDDARPPLNEDANNSDVDDKVGMDSASDGFSLQSQEDAISTNQPTDTTNKEESETDEVLQQKMQNAVDRDIEILGNIKEQSAEPQLSTVTNDEVQEYHFQDKQKVREENMEVQGEEFPARNDAGLPVPDNECKEHNVEDEQMHVEENFDMQGKEPVAADNAKVDGSKAMAAPTSEAATTETELSGEKKLGVAEHHSTYPSTCDAVEGNSADAAHSFGSVPTEVQVMDAKELKEWKKVDMSPSSPTASQVSCVSDTLSESDRKLIEDNEKLREMMEKLIKTGNEQLTAISSLSGRVKDLEKRLSRKKKLKLRRNKVPAAGSTCVKPLNDSLGDKAVALAM
ncbi:BAG family molecular chaperone regulator 6 [Lycium ferocissimum]|uniref:BAG family molecular chaperone regulator 6 n=1 Tax=Lycium ferocissimum TaxID=112874 RepID=UPI0028150401|nr:BAG family molecular chaperone regulator 6 [Lycium ferocissimum]